MVRKVETLSVEWFGMLRKSEPLYGSADASRCAQPPVPTRIRGLGTRRLLRTWKHRRETWTSSGIVASVMKASSSGESPGRTSSPNVSMWNWIADLTSAGFIVAIAFAHHSPLQAKRVGYIAVRVLFDNDLDLHGHSVSEVYHGWPSPARNSAKFEC